MLNGPQKIVLIRAGKYDYAEVELHGAMQIVGPNNTGKTTLINTLQFLYVDDLRTMDFGSYTLEQTLNYYFPDQYSYVLFQCQGAAGQCVIGWRGQSRASGNDPERFCYSGGYDPDEFFDSKRQVREPRDVSARLALKDLRIVKSAQEHREMLLPPAGADAKGLGIVALRDPDRFRRFRESLKDLLSLSTITQDQMRERILTLADVRIDIPALDARKLFGDDYDLIRRRRENLVRFKKHEREVRILVERFSELSQVRGELVFMWSTLRQQHQLFETAHETQRRALKDAGAAQEIAARDLTAQLKDCGAERDAALSEKGGLDARLRELEKLGLTFRSFDPDLSRAAERNLKNEEMRLRKVLSEAETEHSDKARQKVALYQELVSQKQRDIANFDRLAVTTLRRHFNDRELADVFRILNFELLETPVGEDGITLRNEERLFEILRELARRVHSGVYEDRNTRIVLRESRRSIDELAHVEAIRQRLQEDSATLEHWQRLSQAITERERLAAELRERQKELEELQRRLFAYEQFQAASAEEPRLRRDLKRMDEAVAKLSSTLADLERRRGDAEREQARLRQSLIAEENIFNQVVGRFNQCLFPEFAVAPAAVSGMPEDFDSATALFLKSQERERQLRQEVESSLRLTAQLVGEQFNGADDAETIHNLQGELEALPERTEALERDWKALIQGLRGQFAGVLKELEAVRSAAADINRQFSRVQVSNLKAIKLDVLEAGDLVGWIKRLVELEQPGLFEDDTKLDQTVQNFRRKLEGSPLISYAQLFSLRFTVSGDDGLVHHYQDFRQIESHGTTIAVKVLFNLLVLRRYLREDQCVVPFFLDEIQALDPANRAAVLNTARKLGFLAITAAPEAVTEVDALYFLQPKQGRIVLLHRHRVGVKLQPR